MMMMMITGVNKWIVYADDVLTVVVRLMTDLDRFALNDDILN